MNVTQILFVVVVFSILEIMVLSETAGVVEINFPTLQTPTVEFREVGTCSSVEGCIRYLGDSLYNIGAGVLGALLFLIFLAKFVMQLFGLLISLAVVGVDGAPWYINIFISTPLIAGISIIIYKLIRSGGSND